MREASSGGRPPLGPAIVDGLSGEEESKRRLRVILEVNAGKKTVDEACAELSLEKARFYEIQRTALAAAEESLRARAPGRPPKPGESEEARRIRALEKELTTKKLELHAAEIRSELAATMPHLLVDGEKGREKKRRRRPY